MKENIQQLLTQFCLFSVHLQPREGPDALPHPHTLQGRHSQGGQGPAAQEGRLQVCPQTSESKNM